MQTCPYFPKLTANVANYHLTMHYPVAQDNDYATWKADHNQYWPAQYKIVLEHAGEGQYDEIERAIQKLLNYKS